MGIRCNLIQRKRNKRPKKMRKTVIERYKILKGCYMCGYKHHPAALDFAHTNRETKIGNISVLINKSSWKDLLKEIKKCKIMCANCHRVETHNESGWRKGILHHKDDNAEYHTKLTDLFRNEIYMEDA